jgi:type IX secretion system PorP/SprF family membrane protein
MKTPLGHLFIIFVFVGRLQSQDIHFSMFWEPLSHSNPSLIGNFDGDIKLMAQYRSQWSQFNTPLTSFYADATYKKMTEKNAMALGISLIQDQLSFLKYQQHRVAISGSYQSYFSKYLQAGIGAQIGTRLTSIDYNSLTWDRQWNPNSGQFQSALPSGESFIVDNVYSPFFTLGLSANYKKKNILHTVDFSAMYVMRNSAKDFVFYNPFMIHANYHNYIPVGSKNTIMPKVGIIYTSAAHSINSGILFKRNLTETKDIYGGLAYRWGVDRNADALIPVIGMKINRIKFGVSYDFNTSGVNQEGLKNALEICVQYILKSPKNKYYSIDCMRL